MRLKRINDNFAYFNWLNKNNKRINIIKLDINNKLICVYYDIIKPRK